MNAKRKATLHIITSMLAGVLAMPTESHAIVPDSLPEPVTAETYAKPVQVFDIAQGKVVVTLPNTDDMQKQAHSWLARIGPLSPRIKPQWSEGLVIRIPLDRPIRLPDPYGDEFAEELFVFVSAGSNRKAELLVFTKKSQPLLFAVQEELTPFMKKHNLESLLRKNPPSR